MKRLSIGIPILASLAAFVLVLLALLAGSRPCFMEEYDLVSVGPIANTQNAVKSLPDPNRV